MSSSPESPVKARVPFSQDLNHLEHADRGNEFRDFLGQAYDPQTSRINIRPAYNNLNAGSTQTSTQHDRVHDYFRDTSGSIVAPEAQIVFRNPLVMYQLNSNTRASTADLNHRVQASRSLGDRLSDGRYGCLDATRMSEAMSNEGREHKGQHLPYDHQYIVGKSQHRGSRYRDAYTSSREAFVHSSDGDDEDEGLVAREPRRVDIQNDGVSPLKEWMAHNPKHRMHETRDSSSAFNDNLIQTPASREEVKPRQRRSSSRHILDSMNANFLGLDNDKIEPISYNQLAGYGTHVGHNSVHDDTKQHQADISEDEESCSAFCTPSASEDGDRPL